MLPPQKRARTLVITLIAAVVMLSGFGKTIIDTHDSFAKTDRLAAVSLLLAGAPRDPPPVTLLDVDDKSRLDWKAQGSTPHAALAGLIRIARESGARGILLDFDLSRDVPGTPGDPVLLEELRDYPASAPLLMLVRRVGFTGTKATLAAATPYDDAASGKPNIVWVTTLNDAGSDRSVRKIRMWQVICNGAEGVALPSVALVTAARLLDGGRNAGALDGFLAGRVAQECAKTPAAKAAWPPMQSSSAQVPFVFGNDAGSPALLRVSVDGRPTVVLRRVRASLLVSLDAGHIRPMGEIDRDPFEGRVAVIGGSYADSRDLYRTTLGTMPGALILANSIVQARSITETVPASPWIRNLMAFELFLIFAVLARYFVPLVALVSIGFLSVAALAMMSRAFGFESAFDALAIAITGFALFKLTDALATTLLDVPKRGWRAIMKP